MNFIDHIPPDKARHFIGGSLVGMVAASVCVVVAPMYAWAASSAAAAALAGIAVELMQARANRKAGAALRDVSMADATYTAAGGAIVAVPLAVLSLLAMWR